MMMNDDDDEDSDDNADGVECAEAGRRATDSGGAASARAEDITDSAASRRPAVIAVSRPTSQVIGGD